MKKLITLPLIMLLMLGSAYSAFNFSQALGWVVSAKQDNWEVKALCAASQGAACEGAQFLINPQGYVQGKGIGMLGQASPELGKAISAVTNPQGFITQEAITEIAKKNPEAAGGLGEALKTVEQMKAFGVQDGNFKLDTGGNAKEASFKAGKQEGKIGNIVSKDLKEEEVLVSNVKFDKKNGISTLTFEEGGYVKIKDSIFMNIQKGGSLKVNEKGDLTETNFAANQNGGTYVIGNDKISVPPNSRVVFKNGRITITPPKDAQFESLPSLLEKGKSGNVVKIEGFNTELPDGSVVQSGILSYRDGQAFVAPKERAVINGLELKNVFNEKSNTLVDKEFNVFFDGERHEGSSYVSFDMEKRSLIAASPGDKSGHPIRFYEGNPFIDIEKKDNFAIKTFSHSEIEIQNREYSGQIPQIVCKGGCILDENYKSIQSITLGKVNIKLSAAIEPSEKFVGASTSPIELFVLDKEGNSLLKTPQGVEQKMLVSNFKEFATVPADAEDWRIDPVYEGTALQKRISTKLTYNYPTPSNFESLTGGKVMCIMDELCTPEVIRSLSDFYETLTPEAKKSLGEIIIADDKSFKEKGFGKFTTAFAQDDKIFLRNNQVSFFNFRHEASHTQFYSFYSPEIEIKIEEKFNEGKALLEDILDKTQKAETPEQIRELGKLRDRYDSLKKEITQLQESSNPLINEWKQAAKEEYGKRVIKHSLGYYIYAEEGYEKKSEKQLVYIEQSKGVNIFAGPRYGFFMPYGGSSLEEDWAVFHEYVRDPASWKELINPKGKMYDPKYMEKLNLMLKYKGISQEEYDDILKGAGLK